MPNPSISGLQQAQQAMMKKIASLKPGGSFEDAIRFGTIAALRYAISITHVDTGTLRAALRMKLERGFMSGPRGVVYIDPNAVSPARSTTMAGRAKPSKYGPFENARGDSHGFFERVPRERGSTIGRQCAAALVRNWKS